MAALSKRAQLELQGWKFTPVPHFVPAGMLSDSRTGYVSPAFYDHKKADAWVAVPPSTLPIAERRFENRSPNNAVRWAGDQARAPQPDPRLSGVAALAALMQAAGATGVASDIREVPAPCAQRPDAELISACREYLGCERIASELRDGAVPSSESWDATLRTQVRLLSDAVREQNQLLTHVINLPAKTREGVAMKARVIGAFFANTSGIRGAAVRSVMDDVTTVMGEQRL